MPRRDHAVHAAHGCVRFSTPDLVALGASVRPSPNRSRHALPRKPWHFGPPQRRGKPKSAQLGVRVTSVGVVSSSAEPPIRRAACKCGPPPDQCVPDEAFLTQHAYNGKFRRAPRIEREVDVSLLVGNDWSEASATRYILREREPSERQLAETTLRQTTAGALRRVGFAVVHTPGKIKTKPHVSVIWPNSDPLVRQQVPWPPGVSDRFDACFTGNEEVLEVADES
jgi:hypothetical protein